MTKKIKWLSFILLINHTSFVFSQSSTQSMSKSTAQTEENRWNLNNYVWSHTHPQSVKEGKPIIDFDAIENWISVGNDKDVSISLDGNYFAYGIRNCMYKYWKRDST